MTFDSYTSSALDTFSHTTAGSNRVLFLFLKCLTPEFGGISATYAGDAMTLIASEDATDGTGIMAFYKIGPTVGANNVVVTGSTAHVAGTISYHGVRQSAVPDTTHTEGAAATATSRSLSITSVSQSCWKILAVTVNAGTTFTAGAGTTLRSSGAAGQQLGVFDSNGPLVIGASNLVANFGGSVLNVAEGFAFAPTAVTGRMLAAF